MNDRDLFALSSAAQRHIEQMNLVTSRLDWVALGEQATRALELLQLNTPHLQALSRAAQARLSVLEQVTKSIDWSRFSKLAEFAAEFAGVRIASLEQLRESGVIGPDTRSFDRLGIADSALTGIKISSATATRIVSSIDWESISEKAQIEPAILAEIPDRIANSVDAEAEDDDISPANWRVRIVVTLAVAIYLLNAVHLNTDALRADLRALALGLLASLMAVDALNGGRD